MLVWGWGALRGFVRALAGRATISPLTSVSQNSNPLKLWGLEKCWSTVDAMCLSFFSVKNICTLCNYSEGGSFPNSSGLCFWKFLFLFSYMQLSNPLRVTPQALQPHCLWPWLGILMAFPGALGEPGLVVKAWAAHVMSESPRLPKQHLQCEMCKAFHKSSYPWPFEKLFGKWNIVLVLLGQDRNCIFNYWVLSI